MRFPFLISAPTWQASTFTLEEAIAHARYWADKGNPWDAMSIVHEDGRLWTWEIKRGKAHLVEKA